MGLALDLGWTEKLTRQITVVDDAKTDPVTIHFENEEYANPESYTDFVDRESTEYFKKFFAAFAQKLMDSKLMELGFDAEIQAAEERKAQAKEQALLEIVAPIEGTIVSEVVAS